MEILSHHDVEYIIHVSRFSNELISKNDNLHIVHPENNFNLFQINCCIIGIAHAGHKQLLKIGSEGSYSNSVIQYRESR